MKRLVAAAALSTALLLEQSACAAPGEERSAPPRVCEAEIARAATRYNIPVNVLYAVGVTESGRKGSLQAFTLNMAGTSWFGSNLEDALAKFAEARARGITLIDVGCMQINHRFHGQHFASLAAMFDPALNVDYAARFLLQLKASQGSWTMAVARYNAGPNNNPAQKRYVCAVIANMVATGFGNWTNNARQFCL
jgi:soluble lytic murein transglycosylase-like protein